MLKKYVNNYESLIILLEWAPAILTLVVGIIAAWFAVFYAGQPLLEMHGFRQTQTALTTYWMIQDGWRLAYETPVAGYPWSIPMEFPVYQSIVALIAWLGNFKLDTIGRLVSFCFLLACAWPAFMIVRQLNLPSQVAWVFCALLWSSPIYLFWGRTFMIETTALFFTFSAIPFAIDLFNPSPKWQSALFFILFATLGMLQKITTPIPVIMVIGTILLTTCYKNSNIKNPPFRRIFYITIALSLPIFFSMLWMNYSNFVKFQNFLGAELTSGVLTGWNFGTIEQRFDIDILKTIFWDRVIVENAAGGFGIAIIGGALIWGERRVRNILVICVILFALPIFIFTNLHWIHNYYQVSSVIFLIGAMAVALVFIWPESNGRNLVVLIITIIIVTSNFYFFSKGYANNLKMRFDRSQSTILAVSEVIRKYTPEDSAIVIFGADWSSEIAYYAQRKSFTVPGWFKGYDLVWKEPSSFIGGKTLGAIIFCVNENKPSFGDITERPDVKTQPKLINLEPCYIWFPSDHINDLSTSTTNSKLMNFELWVNLFKQII